MLCKVGPKWIGEHTVRGDGGQTGPFICQDDSSSDVFAAFDFWSTAVVERRRGSSSTRPVLLLRDTSHFSGHS